MKQVLTSNARMVPGVDGVIVTLTLDDGETIVEILDAADLARAAAQKRGRADVHCGPMAIVDSKQQVKR